MQLLIFRHGIAEDASPDGSDGARELTPEGVRKTQDAAVGLAAAIEPPAVILTSPKARARQTAAILGRVFKVRVADEPLLADDAIDPIVGMLARRDEPSVMLVGHEPTLSRLMIRLLSGRGGDWVELKKAGCACLSVQIAGRDASAVLHWLLTPKMLRKLK